MRMIDVAIPKFGDDDSPPTSRPTINPVVGHTSFARSRTAEDDEEYNVEHEDSGSDEEGSEDGTERGDGDKEDEGAEKDVFFDTQDMAEGVSFDRLATARRFERPADYLFTFSETEHSSEDV